MSKISIPKDLLQDLYLNQRLTTYQVAEKLDVCQATIWKRLHEFKIKPRLSYVPVGFTKEQLKKWYLNDRLSTWEIQKRFGYSRSSLHRKLLEHGIDSRNISVSHVQYQRKDFSGGNLEKAYLTGFRIGDLNVTKRGSQSETITVKCASTKRGQLKLFNHLFSKYGHILQGKSTKEGKTNIQVNLNLSFSFLLDKKPENYKWVFEKKSTFLAFMGGFSDAEGSFFISRGSGTFAIGNYDRSLLLKIKLTLNKLGIKTPQLSVYYQEQRKIYNGYCSKGDYYSLTCSKKVYLLKLLSFIKPYIKHPDKSTKLQLVEDNILKRNLRFGSIN